MQRLIIIGVGKLSELHDKDYIRLGGVVAGKLPSTSKEVTLILDLPETNIPANCAANVQMGMNLRSYNFDQYKTKKKDDDEKA